MTAAAVIAHSMPFGAISPTRDALPTPAATSRRGERSAPLVELGMRDAPLTR